MTTDVVSLGVVALDAALDLGGRVPAELVVFPLGHSESTLRDDAGNPVDWTTDELAGRVVVARFRDLRRDVVVDYEHATEKADERHDGTAPAAGWIKDVYWDAQRGVVAKVEWLPLARQRIASREYRYFSPTFERGQFPDDVIRPIAIKSIGLTNSPASKGMQPIVAKAADEGDLPDVGSLADASPLELETIAGLLGLAPGATRDEIERALREALDQQARGGALGGGANRSSPQAPHGTPSLKDQTQALRDVVRAAAKRKEHAMSQSNGAAAGTTPAAQVPKELYDQLAAQIKTMQADVVSLKTEKESETKTLREQIATLQKRNADLEFDTIVASDKHKGKIPPAALDKWRGLFHADRKTFDDLIEGQPVIASDKSALTSAAAAQAGGGAASDTRHEYLRKVDEVVAKTKKPKLDAIAIVQRENPDLYKDFLETSPLKRAG